MTLTEGVIDVTMGSEDGISPETLDENAEYTEALESDMDWNRVENTAVMEFGDNSVAMCYSGNYTIETVSKSNGDSIDVFKLTAICPCQTSVSPFLTAGQKIMLLQLPLPEDGYMIPVEGDHSLYVLDDVNRTYDNENDDDIWVVVDGQPGFYHYASPAAGAPFWLESTGALTMAQMLNIGTPDLTLDTDNPKFINYFTIHGEVTADCRPTECNQ